MIALDRRPVRAGSCRIRRHSGCGPAALSALCPEERSCVLQCRAVIHVDVGIPSDVSGNYPTRRGRVD